MRMNNLVIAGIGVSAFVMSLAVFYLTSDSATGPAPAGVAARGLETGIAPANADPPPADDSLALQIAALARSQRALEKAVARLEQRLDGLVVAATPTDVTTLGPSDPETELALAAAVERAQAEAGAPPGIAQPRQRFLNAGFSEDETDSIIRAVDENTLARLQLRYQAARGGDDGRAARDELRSLPRAREVVRDEFGENAYDRYLYATGQPNRIVVQGVLNSSPAQDAGLQPGDTLLHLDDQPIYALGDLMRISASGSESDLVPLTVLRGGEVMQVSVPRGPLGINASVDSIDPTATPAG